MINYSEHGSIVDGVLYSCDFSQKAPQGEEPVLLLDDVLSLGEGRRALNAKRRLEAARANLRDKERAKLALSSALKLSKSINKDCVIDPNRLPDSIRRQHRYSSSSSESPSSPESSCNDSHFAPSTSTSSNPADSRSHENQSSSSASSSSSPFVDKNSTKTHSLLAPPPSSLKPLSCLCKKSASSVIGGSGKGWEGSVLVSHGSKLRFGCIQLVLSVADRPGHVELLHALVDAHLL